jgi:hypothetical protein
MSETGQSASDEGGPSLEQHPFVEALVPDPSQGPPNATVLRGFLGKSTTEGVWRLYLTAALDEYVEIPEADILHSRQLLAAASDEDEGGGAGEHDFGGVKAPPPTRRGLVVGGLSRWWLL